MAPRDRFILDDTEESYLPVAVTSIEADAEAFKVTTKRRKNVTFHLVHVREFDRVVGDHPEVKVGPPIALGWNYVAKSPVLVDVYDMDRELNSRKSAKKLDRLTSIARKNLLLEYGFTESDFRTAEQDVKLVQDQRATAKSEVKKVADDRTKLQRIGRSLRKNFMRSLSATAKVMGPPSMVAF